MDTKVEMHNSYWVVLRSKVHKGIEMQGRVQAEDIYKAGELAVEIANKRDGHDYHLLCITKLENL